jgi:hypothetical protein
MSPSWSQAAPFPATESIQDIGFDLNSRDLERTRTDLLGSTTLGTDATIISQNNVGAGFGLNGTGPDAYQHNMNWISPAMASILTASLYIDAFGVGGSGILGLTPNDAVYADGNFIGNLNVGTILTLGVSLTSFTINPLWLTDGLLNIQINHSSGDQFSVFGSKLAIDYNGAAGAVPEPSSILLMGSGLAGLGLYGRRKMALAMTK